MKPESYLKNPDNVKSYHISGLIELITDPEIGEERVSKALSSFLSYENPDVEDYIRNKSIGFDKQSIARTHLVYADFEEESLLVGYFTLTNGWFDISEGSFESKTFKKKVLKFSRPTENSIEEEYRISAPLIAQLSKNFFENRDKLITGNEMLALACDHVREIQLMMGGKITYIECEDKPKIIDFYTRNGFRQFGIRRFTKDGEEKYLLQMLKLL